MPAYREFLLDMLGRIPHVRTMEEFRALPMMDKENYIFRYPADSLYLDGTILGKHCFTKSTGTSGSHFYWPHLPEEEIHSPQGLRNFMSGIVTEKTTPTLVLIGFDFDIWSTGQTTAWSFRSYAQQTPGVTLATPAMNVGEIVRIFKAMCPKFRQTVLFTYPPFALTLLRQAERDGVCLKDLNLMLVLAGEGFTERFRDSVCAYLGGDHGPYAMRSIYGSSDFGDVGIESGICVTLRRLAYRENAAEELFGTREAPMLFQILSEDTHFEIVDGELVASRIQGLPVVRYRSGDGAQIVSYRDMFIRVAAAGFYPLPSPGVPPAWPDFKRPFMLLHGRLDNAVHINGVSVTLNQLKAVMDCPGLAEICEGKFLARNVADEEGKNLLEIVIAASPRTRQADLAALARIFSEELARYNTEYATTREYVEKEIPIRVTLGPEEALRVGWKYRFR